MQTRFERRPWPQDAVGVGVVKAVSTLQDGSLGKQLEEGCDILASQGELMQSEVGNRSSCL